MVYLFHLNTYTHTKKNPTAVQQLCLEMFLFIKKKKFNLIEIKIKSFKNEVIIHALIHPSIHPSIKTHLDNKQNRTEKMAKSD